MTPLLALTGFELLSEYRVRLTFDDGRTVMADLASIVSADPRTVFAQLRDADIFRNARLEHGTLAWPNGLDGAPAAFCRLLGSGPIHRPVLRRPR